MKILIYGAGVLGSLYAARLQDGGQDVTVLARGQRLEDIRQHGLVLENTKNGAQTVTRLQVTARLGPDDAYDLAIVLVRNNQLNDVLPVLAANHCIPAVLFMVNNASGPQELIQALGPERVLLGFPGAGGTRAGYLIRYNIVPAFVQPTTLGELDGRITPRLLAIQRAFQAGGFPTALCRDMNAWLKTHVAWVSPVANALYLAGGDNYRMARTPDAIVPMLRAIRESFRVLKFHHIPVTPSRLRMLQWLPEPLLVGLFRLVLNTHFAEIVITRHANSARDEMQALADAFQQLARAADVPTPNLDYLYSVFQPDHRFISANTPQPRYSRV